MYLDPNLEYPTKTNVGSLRKKKNFNCKLVTDDRRSPRISATNFLPLLCLFGE